MGHLFIIPGVQPQNEMESEIERAWNLMNTALGPDTCPVPELTMGTTCTASEFRPHNPQN